MLNAKEQESPLMQRNGGVFSGQKKRTWLALSACGGSESRAQRNSRLGGMQQARRLGASACPSFPSAQRLGGAERTTRATVSGIWA